MDGVAGAFNFGEIAGLNDLKLLIHASSRDSPKSKPPKMQAQQPLRIANIGSLDR